VTKPAFPALPGRFLTINNQGSPNNIYYMRPLLRAALVSVCPLEKGMANHSSILGASLVAQMVKNLPAMQEIWV